MSEAADVIDSIADSDGDRIWVEVLGPNVYLTQVSHGFSCCVRLDAAGQERFARAYVAACYQAAGNAEQAAPSDGMNAVERAARELIGIPDNL